MDIEVTCKTEGRPISVNINKIQTYRPNKNEDNTIIDFGMNGYIIAKESYSEVKELIAYEVAAERGY